jgi:hypothetical protein
MACLAARYCDRDEAVIARLVAVRLSRPVQVVLTIVQLTFVCRQAALLGKVTARNQLANRKGIISPCLSDLHLHK